ncbi:hypothetical protein [Halomarina pelagica]|uniref:hypothetical protein n=1 Tax=Halomarina pelagica TaxID=2961599 RepID=UPI0020C51EF6|nr:hypothetical protein [Halomarina sp. BND7]
MSEITDRRRFRHAVARTPRFVYGNGLRLVVLSLAWFVCSLPLLTIGPATLAVYVALRGLRSDRNAIDTGEIRSVLRRNGIPSVLCAGVPVAFGVVAGVYGVRSLQTGTLVGEIIALVAGYVAIYAVLALIPTFVAMASGTEAVAALRYGVGWLATHPTAALATGLLTVIVLASTLLLTVAFPLLFAAISFSLHISIVESLEVNEQDSIPRPQTNGTA